MNEKHPKNASIFGDPATMNEELRKIFVRYEQKSTIIHHSSFLIYHLPVGVLCL